MHKLIVVGRLRTSRRCSERRSQLGPRCLPAELSDALCATARDADPAEERLFRDESLPLQRLPFVDLGIREALPQSSRLEAGRFTSGVRRDLRRMREVHEACQG